MTPQRYCCTLQQSKRLRELGVDAPSMFNWVCLMPDPTGEKWYYEIMYHNAPEQTLSEVIAPAYTDGELFDLIPHSHGDSLLCVMPPNEGNEYLWTCLYLPLGTSIMDYTDDDYSDGDTLAECLASFLITLKEPQQVNNQLK